MSYFLRLLLLVSVIASVPLHADEKHIALIRSGDIPPYVAAQEGFKTAVTQKNKTITFSFTEFSADQYLSDDQSRKADLIVTIGSKATEKFSKSIKDIPIVYSMLMNPRFDDANITGVTMDIPPRQELSILRKLLPRSRKIGIIFDPAKSKIFVDRIINEAGERGFEVITTGVNSVEDVYGALRSISKHVDVLMMVPDSTVYTRKSTEDILLFSLREGLPVIGLSPTYVKAGALFSLSCDYTDIGRQSGEIALKILQGADPKDIPPAHPERFELSLNLITAERIGITIPNDVLKEARNVYR